VIVRPAPSLVVVGVVAWLGALLALDREVGVGGELLLGGATLAVLVAVAIPLAPERRAQVAVVVAVATCFEVRGSIIWGVYRYRHGNLPLFVPPAHGLVYLGGSRSAARGRSRADRSSSCAWRSWEPSPGACSGSPCCRAST